jgi:hypothetical protein
MTPFRIRFARAQDGSIHLNAPRFQVRNTHLSIFPRLNEIGKRPSPTTSTDEAHSFWDAKLTYFTHYPAQVLLPVVYELCALATKVSTATEDNVSYPILNSRTCELDETMG